MVGVLEGELGVYFQQAGQFLLFIGRVAVVLIILSHLFSDVILSFHGTQGRHGQMEIGRLILSFHGTQGRHGQMEIGRLIPNGSTSFQVTVEGLPYVQSREWSDGRSSLPG